jgi:hypothetical protein
MALLDFGYFGLSGKRACTHYIWMEASSKPAGLKPGAYKSQTKQPGFAENA